MIYTQETLNHLEEESDCLVSRLNNIVMDLLREISPKLKNQRSKEYLDHGVCRRIKVLKRSIEKIYEIFPPNRKEKLTFDELTDVQIYLHAFLINLFGVLDNLAWVYVLEHNLEAKVGGRKGVGLYTNKTQKILPPRLKSYLNLQSTKDWQDKYVKNYRDALAHRIPLYIPPLTLTHSDIEKWKKLETYKWVCFKDNQHEAFEAVIKEQESLGEVCYFFLHSFDESGAVKPYIHAQLLVDAATIAELCSVFIDNIWELA